jgi:putative nucleotidyltransferase with HDIG domain
LIPLNEKNDERSLQRWMRLAQEHDLYLYRHSLAVSELARTFAAFLGFSSADQSRLWTAGLLHDIGKIRIPVELLGKPIALNLAETTEMREHPLMGERLLEAEGYFAVDTLMAVRNHHERLDGTGYPFGLRATEISEPVRIVTLCDIFAAMTEERPYATPCGWKNALETMTAKRTWLDLRLMKQFATMTTALRGVQSDSGRQRVIQAEFLGER